MNQNLSVSNLFPDPNEQVEICATVANTGTTNIFDVVVDFYLDDVTTAPIHSHLIDVLPTTYMDLPFREETVCFNWTVPGHLSGPQRIWVKLTGDFPLSMTEDMTGNNYAVVDFAVNDLQPAVTPPSTCPAAAHTAAAASGTDNEVCTTEYMLVPVAAQVCEDEIICGPVIGIELSFWATIYWPSWSGYCQEFGVPQEAITDFIRTYERLVGLGSQGAGSSLPSLLDIPGILTPPDGWSDGWLPCHPEPTLFGYLVYEGVIDPGCGGVCPVSAWDCGQGVQFQPRFDSPYYNAYDYKVSGGARRVSRCYTDSDYIRVPYQFCHEVPGDPDQPVTIPFDPFQGAPGGPDNGFGGNGIGGPGTGPGGGPPLVFTLGPPTDPNDDPVPMTCTFCSTGTKKSYDTSDTILCVPTAAASSSGSPVVETLGPEEETLATERPTDSAAELGGWAPEFVLATADGGQRSLADLRGQSVLLVFGNTRCRHCRQRLFLLNQLHALSPETGLQVIFIATGSSPAEVQRYLAENEIHFEVAIDSTGRVGHDYGVTRVPACFLVDETGVLSYAGPQQGSILWYYLSQWAAGRNLSLPTGSIQRAEDTVTEANAPLVLPRFGSPSGLTQTEGPHLQDLQQMTINWLIEDQSDFTESGCVAP